MEVYSVLYIDMEFPSESYVTGIYRKKEDAICSLINSAGYKKVGNGQLLQYGLKSVDYQSYQDLVNTIEKEMRLVDGNTDIYLIEKHVVK